LTSSLAITVLKRAHSSIAVYFQSVLGACVHRQWFYYFFLQFQDIYIAVCLNLFLGIKMNFSCERSTIYIVFIKSWFSRNSTVDPP